MPRVLICEQDFDIRDEITSLRAADGGVGAVVSFLGTVRDRQGAQCDISSLELEHYPGMTEASIEAMIDEAFQRFDIRAARVVHRIGLLQPLDQIVWVAVTSAHRGEAFQACEFLMDYLKTQAPFWKKEVTPDGARWVDARVSDDQALRRWGLQADNAGGLAAPGSQTSDPAGASCAIVPATREALRGAFGRFATGVTIVTCLDAAGGTVGLTANSFSSLSMDPPLLLWSLRQQSVSLSAFEKARHFAINVLAESQVELSRRFASPIADKFSEGVWGEGIAGVPLLAGAAATFECELLSQRDEGDHRLFIGRVLRVFESSVAPLVYRSGHYHLLGEVL